MLEAGWGRLLAIASTAGLKGYPYVAGYCAAKHGVVGLTRALALETARTGVTVNAICPGYMLTPMLERSLGTIMAKTGRTRAEAEAPLLAANPQGRFIDPAEIAAAVLWLVSDAAASVTGQAISISGGET
jgi:NAD(P)-dependent dehydrogenase (short-subunit alcohol dehydrogenase family)